MLTGKANTIGDKQYTGIGRVSWWDKDNAEDKSYKLFLFIPSGCMGATHRVYTMISWIKNNYYHLRK